ncbi:MAG TPA: nucleoside monophosphate kinase, partial [Terriglobales bacterium]|nr:nucleoside monophosphate kinase [Terriglobales bacterium]
MRRKSAHGLEHSIGTLPKLQGLRPAAIIFLGPPGAGKGTQALQVAKEHGLPHISTGDVFRSHVANKTALGLKASEAMSRGMLVADDLVCNMLAEYIQSLDHVGCMVLDGFPRSVAQAKWLDRFLRTRTGGITELPYTAPLAIQISVKREQLIRRLSGRRSCTSCGRIYNLHFHPTMNDGVCDYDGSKLQMRPDDAENVVLERLMVHEKNTFPLTEYYRHQGQLREIDGNDAVDTVR